MRLRILDPPFSVPAVLVRVPLKEWVKPAPRFRMPVEDVAPIVRATPAILPVKVAVPEAFVIATLPLVEKWPML